MNTQEKETPEATSAAPEANPQAGWQSPDYTVVETSLEVTGYRLADR